MSEDAVGQLHNMCVVPINYYLLVYVLFMCIINCVICFSCVCVCVSFVRTCVKVVFQKDSIEQYVDASQLTSDLGGTLCYDHMTWVSNRVVSCACTYAALRLL